MCDWNDPQHIAWLSPVFKAIDRKLLEKECVSVAVDGMCGSGKSTLAKILAAGYDCNVIPMDAFFLPASLRSEDRLAAPGGNIHYERFQTEILDRLKDKKPIVYHGFDHSAMDIGEEITAPQKRLTVIEGSYCLHPVFGNPYDLRLFVTCSPAEQSERIFRRNGAAMHELFASTWIPMENRYFACFGISKTCDYILNTGLETVMDQSAVKTCG